MFKINKELTISATLYVRNNQSHCKNIKVVIIIIVDQISTEKLLSAI